MQVPVALTDIHEALPALKANVDLNPALKHVVLPMVLDWNAPDIPSVVSILHGVHAQRISAPKNLAMNSSFENFSQEIPSPDDRMTHTRSLCSEADARQSEHKLHNQRNEVPDSSDGGSVLVLASDCVWVQDLIDPFVKTLQQTCNAFNKALVLLAHKSRSKYVDTLLLDRLKHKFEIEEMPQLPGECRGSIKIFKLVPNGTV